jgi:RNA polymerase sigma factor (TIGR02999 family)
MTEVSRILVAIGEGDTHAADQLLPLIYDELRKLAARKLAHEKPGQTLEATALVHEAYLRLVDAERAQNWNSRGHFFAAAAEAMRRILVENARRKRSARAGGNRRRVALSDVEPATEGPHVDLLALDEALMLLEAKDKRKADVIKLRFFGRLTNAQTAEALGISPATADNDWAYAKTWLRVAMCNDRDPGRGSENSKKQPGTVR